MAFDLASAKPVSSGFDMASARPVAEDQPSLLDTIKNAFTPEGASSLVKSAANYPLDFPANPFKISEAVTHKNPAKAYFELMPQLEKGAEEVSSSFNKSVNVDKFPFLGNVGKAVSMSVFPPRPSAMMLAAGGGAEARLPGVPLGIMTSPSAVEQGSESVMRGLGQEGLTPESAGKSIQDIYKKRLTIPMAEMLREPPAPKEPPPPRSGQEIFGPAYKKVSSQINPEEITGKKLGETVTAAYDKKTKSLLGKERAAWSALTDEHSDKPASLENTKNYIESVFQQRGAGVEPSYLEQLNPALRDAAMQQENPEQFARKLYEQNRGSVENIAPGQSTNAPVPQLTRGMGVLNKVFEASNAENLTFGQLKTLRTQLGDLINWTPGYRDSLNHTLKQVYKSMTEDAASSAESGGFTKSFSAAKQATKDFYNYTEKPSSQIISKANYPEDLPSKLIKADSPSRVEELFSQHDLSKADKNIVRRGTIDQMAKDANYDPKKFLQKWKEFGTETQKAMFEEKAKLVDSLAETAKALDEEISKSKEKILMPTAKTREDILSKSGLELDNIMKRSKPSQLIENILQDGTPEMTKSVKGVVGEKGMGVLRRGAINQFIGNSKTELPNGDYRINLGNMSKELNKMTPEFISEYFGDDAKTIMAMRDASKYFIEESKTAGMYPQAARFIPFRQRIFFYLSGIGKKYKLTGRVNEMIRNMGDAKLAEQVAPIGPNILRPLGTMGYSKNLRLMPPGSNENQ